MDDWKNLPKILSYQHDWNIVNRRILEEREKGINYLKKVLADE